MTVDGPEVRPPAGPVRGVWRGRSAAFLGMPFAEAPVAELRFAPPRRLGVWSRVRPATAFGPTPQRRAFADVTTIPEPSIPGASTLNLNVCTPAPGDRSARLPVLVWVHGGGFIAGSPASPWYDGRSFNTRGVVTVSVSYRLGFHGFGWIADAPSNRGLHDVVAALEWVADNIEWFGGDPAHVTIAGQSAGGGIVLSLLAAPKARGLFARAAVSSGVPAVTPAARHAEDGRRLAATVGVDPTRQGWSRIPAARVVDLDHEAMSRAGGLAPAHPHAAAVERTLTAGYVNLPFGPAVDGDLLPDPGAIDWSRSAVPLLIGATADEFVQPGTPRPATGHLARWLADLVQDDPGPWLSGCDDPIDPVGRLTTNLMIHRPMMELTHARETAGVAPTWLYEFAAASPVTGTAMHCHDLPYLWHLLDAERVSDALGAAPPRWLADDLHQAWAGFIGTGSPGWPRAGADGYGRRYTATEATDGIIPIDRSGPAARHPFVPGDVFTGGR